jgi:hypothetical protein
MSEDRHVPAEVIGAQLDLGVNSRAAVSGGAQQRVIAAYSPVGPDADRIFDDIVSADSVDIVGILPWQCAARLKDIAARRIQARQHIVDPAHVRYFTPARSQIAVYRHSGALGSLAQRWLAGITGVRNWLAPRGTSHAGAGRLLHEFEDIYLDCLVHVTHGSRHQVTAFNQLPLIRTARHDQGAEETSLLITLMPEGQVRRFQGYLDSLARQSKELVSRVVLCEAANASEPAREQGREFQPRISCLRRYDAPRVPGSVVPVAVIAVCAPTAHGPAVLLKRRTEWNSREDFGTLSLVSERVLEEDFPEIISDSLSDNDDRALDELWLRIGSPRDFEVPEQVFRRAAQRELFMSCGLDISGDRLELHGTCLLDREGEDTFLGFYVYTVQLARSAAFDELTHAMAWNSDLELVPVSRLYDAANRPRLNRLLRRRDSWLREQVFNKSRLRSVAAGDEPST